MTNFSDKKTTNIFERIVQKEGTLYEFELQEYSKELPLQKTYEKGYIVSTRNIKKELRQYLVVINTNDNSVIGLGYI